MDGSWSFQEFLTIQRETVNMVRVTSRVGVRVNRSRGDSSGEFRLEERRHSKWVLRLAWGAVVPGLAFIAATLLWVVGPSPAETEGVSGSLDGRDGVAATKQEDTIDRDYSDELPRIPPSETPEAMTMFSVAPGFEVQLVAQEPDVVDPVAMAFDEDGRLFVVEMRDYSEDYELTLGRIRLLEDRDGDGVFETSTLFAEDLAWPTAVIAYDGGIFVGAAPNIYYLKDTTGDGQADQREVVFTGFQLTNVQGLLNSFHWGLDNRIHGATSSSGAEVQRVVDGEVQPEKLALRGRDFSFDPRTLEMRAESGGAQHGMSFNGWGRKFVCSNSDHIQLVMFEERYAARNPYAVSPSARTSIAEDGPQADVYRTSPVEPWRIVRTRLRAKGVVPGVVEGGGRPAGYFTGATGVTIYTGDAWPEKYRNWAFVGDVGGNLVHRKRLEPDGVGLIAKRVDEQAEFVSSSDIWFRPVQFSNAPDGTFYILDMYREVIEHPASLHPVIKQHLDLTSGRDRGRLYRVAPEGFEATAPPRLSEASNEELVALLDHRNGWHRETAARLLYERNPAGLQRRLEQLVTEGENPEGRIRALAMLQSFEGVTPALVRAALADENPHVRRHAIRASEPFLNSDAPLLQQVVSMTRDEDLLVRYQLAFSLGECEGESRSVALADIVKQDGELPYIRFAVHSSLETGAGPLLARLSSDPAFTSEAHGREFLQLLAAQIGRQQRSEDVAAVLRVLTTVTEQSVLQAILTGLAPRAGSPLERQVSAAAGGKTDAVMQTMLAEARQVAADLEGEVKARVDAIHLLQLSQFDEEQELLSELLLPEQSIEVQEAALKSMATFPEPAIAAMILENWSIMGPRLRSSAGELLASRPVWLEKLLDAVEAGEIPPSDLAPALRQSLTSHADADLRMRGQQLLANTVDKERDEVLNQYQSVLTMEGDAARGLEVFRKTCSGCHRLQGIGHEIGPNLAAMQNRGPESILSNVIAPNAEVNPQYMTYVVTTKDGRTLSGMIADESAASVTLRKAENQQDTVLRIDIEEMRSTGLSLMPDGIEKDVSPEEMADLIAFLLSLE
jgi:putative membrane-bound dehydrogenase-like protein